MKHIPSLEQAEAYVREAEQMNPGPWVAHSRYVAQAASAIARRCPPMNADVAYTLGLLHDIGRREGVTAQHHIYAGYVFMLEQGWPDVARVCLTHSFSARTPAAKSGSWDCNEQETRVVDEFIQNTEFDDYDKLIILCDAISTSTGYWLMEKRMVDVVIRYGAAFLNEYTPAKWKGYLDIQKEFEQRMGCSIYSLLDGVMENTFLFKN